MIIFIIYFALNNVGHSHEVRRALGYCRESRRERLVEYMSKQARREKTATFNCSFVKKQQQKNIHFSQIHEEDGIVGFAILALEAFENNGEGT